jgi:glucosamine--fructose-6-phosphate aminotransferase (isomerizing)
MCGIVGYIGNRKAVPIILEGLKRLEYRGYDSAGLAVYCDDDQLAVRRASGKLRNLEEAIRLNPVDGAYGIGHTRWATHGRPTEENAHPHRDCTGDIVVVHNGIVENYLALKRQLQAEGHSSRRRPTPKSSRTWWRSTSREIWKRPCARRSRNSPASSRWR